ncbi:MAG TPA: class I SAM-dependent methyltransferase [Bacillota bacterium]|jgi:predicted methyltransferase|nr:class I SAM-dependent methyltransferase [Bacillota bacterium]HQE10433.1 class I SAM-dependent methyltransferase [Bacillota bacterium]
MIRITEIAQKQVAEILREGDQAVDATAGNGRDTLFLARLVGSSGRVYAFDIQQEALDETAALLDHHNMSERVDLIHAGHETMAAYVEGPVTAVMFNLGYRPGGDRSIVTRPESTLRGLAAAIQLLKPGGLATLVLYPGHAEGEKEKSALLEYCSGFDGSAFGVVHSRLLNRGKAPPELLIVKKFGQYPQFLTGQ